MPSLPPAISLSHTERGRGPMVIALHDLGRSGDVMLRALKPLTKREWPGRPSRSSREPSSV